VSPARRTFAQQMIICPSPASFVGTTRNKSRTPRSTKSPLQEDYTGEGQDMAQDNCARRLTRTTMLIQITILSTGVR